MIRLYHRGCMDTKLSIRRGDKVFTKTILKHLFFLPPFYKFAK